MENVRKLVTQRKTTQVLLNGMEFFFETVSITFKVLIDVIFKTASHSPVKTE